MTTMHPASEVRPTADARPTADTRPRADARHMQIALLPGDGVGPEVTNAAREVLDATAKRFGHTVAYSQALIGGAAIDACGDPLPEQTIRYCLEADAVFLGAVGGPKWDALDAAVRPEKGLLRLRKALGVFANLRPVAPFPALAYASPIRAELLDGVDVFVVRELTGGIYFGEKRRDTYAGTERAVDVCTYTTAEVERIARVAGVLARERRRRLVSVDKANVLETSRLWREVMARVIADEFSDVKLEHMLVDTAAMRLMQCPAYFDVIVTENMFGDILTDEAAVLSGSIGLLPSASLAERTGTHGRFGLYEPIHGSAPDIAGRDVANPIGAILSAAMLLRCSFGLEQEAVAIEQAVCDTIADGVLTADVARAGSRAMTTSAVAAHVVDRVAYEAESKEAARFAPAVPIRAAYIDRAR